MKHLNLMILALLLSYASSFAQIGAIGGPTSICIGSTGIETDTTAGGTWSSSNPSFATVGATTGIVTGVMAGIVNITYTVGASYSIQIDTIVPGFPGGITGPSTLCTGVPVTEICAPTGGVWTSSNPTIATVGSASGIVNGVAAGTATITYTISPSCYTRHAVTVNAGPAPITGTSALCTGTSITLSDLTPGGTFSSGSASIATVGSSTGIVTGVTTGPDTITYTISITGCTSIKPITVYPTPGPITGPGTVCIGSCITLAAGGGGTWTTSGGFATVGAFTGSVCGVSAGVANITYTVSTGCLTTRAVTIYGLPTVYTVIGGGAYCSGGSGVTVGLSGSQTGVTYQLFIGGVAGALVAGTGTAISFGLQTVAGIYTVVATSGSTACSAAMSGSATVSINPMPTLYTVTGGGSYCVGGSGVSVGLSGSQTGFNYQLYNGLIPFGTPVPGSGTALNFGMYTAPGAYKVIADNPATGCIDTMSDSAVITITSLPTVYTVTGGGSYCSGGAGRIVGLSGSTSGTSYQLYLGGAAYGTAVSGTGSALNFGLMTTAGLYTVSATGGTGCAGTMSGSATVAVDPLPSVYSVTGGGSYCAGGSGVSIGLSGSQTGVNYQLYRGGTVIGSPMSGTGSAISFGMQTVAGSYTVHATSVTTTCAITMTGSATVVIDPLPAAYTIAGGGSYCSGGPGVHITLSGSVVGVSYQLYLGGIAVGSPLAGTGGTLDFGVFTGTGTYTIVATDSTTTCVSSMSGSVVIAVNPLPTAYTVTGGGTYCTGGSGVLIGLSNSQVGVSYQLYVGGVAVGTTVSGTGASISFGLHTTTGTYTVEATNVTTLCSNTMTGSVSIGVSALPTVYTVTGGGSYCSGGTGAAVGLDNSNTGINYQLYVGGIVTGLPVAGTGSSISFGLQTTAGTYTIVATNSITSCSDNMTGSATVTVMPTTGPPTVSITASPGLSVCAGTTVTFTATPTVGGTSPGYQWSVNGTAVTGATSATYSYMPLAGDLVGVTLTSSSPCVVPATATATVSTTVTAMVTPTVAIVATPGTTVCSGTTVLYTTTVTGSGSMPAYQWAVNGVPAGTGSTYSYVPLAGDVIVVNMTSSATCIITPLATYSVTMTIDVPAITASTASAGCGPTQTLTAGGGSSYSWSPSTGLSCTTCSSATLIPDATTQYTVTGTDGLGCSGTDTVTVDGNRISGYITYTGTTADTFTVWLIQFNPIDSSISATDSTTSCFSSGTPYYEFMDKPAGNYLVKARLNSAVPGASGYIPTYSLSTSHWYSATSLAHSSSYDSMHINMLYGTVPPGPGFIAGYVVSGAGRNTSVDAPARGMVIYLTDTTGHLLSHTYTDSAGIYSFSNLIEGSYMIYPENYKYYTTPSSVITLAPGADSATTVDFKQHNSSGTITPYQNTRTPAILSTAKGISVYPNPATGILNIRSDKASEGTADIIFTDITGRQVLKNKVELNALAGNTISLSGISDGIYLITIKSEKVFYSGKLVIEQ